MKKIGTWFNNLAFRSKTLLCFFVVMIAAFVTIEVLYYAESKKAMTDLANSSTTVIIEQAQSSVEAYIEGISRLIRIIENDAEVRAFCQQDESNTSFLKISLSNKFNNFQNIYENVTAIAIITEKEDFVSNELYQEKDTHVISQDWYRNAADNPGELQISTNPYSRNVAYSRPVRMDNILSVSKSITDEFGRPLGVILVDVNMEVIENTLKKAIPGSGGFVMILDTDGRIVYSPVNAVAPRVDVNWLNEKSGIIERRIHGEDYQIIYGTTEDYGWKTAGIYSTSSTFKQISNTRDRLIVILFIIALLAFGLFTLTTSSITRPMDKMTSIMNRVRNGEMDLRFNVLYRDEFGQMGETFNSLLDRIQELLDVVYREQEQKRLAELNVLQAQIKPHFLYNTLDTIHWMSKKHGADDVAYIVRCLANLFRISLSKGGEIISLKDEIAHVENYMKIQEVRYKDIMTYSISLDLDPEVYHVQKLILQPLVENAIYHGIKEKRAKSLINVDVGIKDNFLIMTVSDDGVGIAPERLEQINNMLESGQNTTGRFGLFNVNQRIQIAFGKDYGVKVSSIHGKGTNVSIYYPVIYSVEQYYEMTGIPMDKGVSR